VYNALASQLKDFLIFLDLVVKKRSKTINIDFSMQKHSMTIFLRTS